MYKNIRHRLWQNCDQSYQFITGELVAILHYYLTHSMLFSLPTLLYFSSSLCSFPPPFHLHPSISMIFFIQLLYSTLPTCDVDQKLTYIIGTRRVIAILILLKFFISTVARYCIVLHCKPHNISNMMPKHQSAYEYRS